MNYDQAMRKIDFLNNRLRKMIPWYKWAIKHSWQKVDRWYEILGYKKSIKK